MIPKEMPHQIRVRVLDGKPTTYQQVRGKLVPHVRVHDVKQGREFIVSAEKLEHLDQVRAKFAAAGLEEIAMVETQLAAAAPPERQMPYLSPKPYGFVPLPDDFNTEPPVWHDGTAANGTSTKDLISGEIRCELTALSPLLVGWERETINEDEEQREIELEGRRLTLSKKSFLCPLRAPGGGRPVLLTGDSIKGLLRHELGALLGAPMERVEERSYSYRPNLTYPRNNSGRVLEPRFARIKNIDRKEVEGKVWICPKTVDVLFPVARSAQTYYPNADRTPAPAGALDYRGGLGGGKALPKEALSPEARHKLIHTRVSMLGGGVEHSDVDIDDEVMIQYARTLEHLVNLTHGHFSSRHPGIGKNRPLGKLAADTVGIGAQRPFKVGDLVWIEWDSRPRSGSPNGRIVSIGWHYYYKWAYADTVRKTGWTRDRDGLVPRDAEKACADATDAQGNHRAPRELSPVRRLFGYTGDNEGSRCIGKGDHSQLMGRLSVNAAIEVVAPGETDESRFLPPTFLKELGLPRPSAVEHYLQQPYQPGRRPSDRAKLATYGDAVGGAAKGYDDPGKLAGRKFYLDRVGACSSEPWNDASWDDECWKRAPWSDDSEANRLNERSTLALQASRPGRKFRFTVRFRDLDPAELAAVVAALSPHQFREALGQNSTDEYCSKLGYARPLGWGSVRIETKAYELDARGEELDLKLMPDLSERVRKHVAGARMLEKWLAVHRRNHDVNEADDYPKHQGTIVKYHTKLRGEHAQDRRYDLGPLRPTEDTLTSPDAT